MSFDKYHLIFGKNEDELSLKNGGDIITDRKEQKLLGVIMDKNLSCKSASEMK